MTTSWIVVANSSVARLYANDGPKKGLKKLKEMEHAASREKGSDLITDGHGRHWGAGGGGRGRGAVANGRGAYSPSIEPKQMEHERFAQQLARELEQGRTSNSYQRLIVVAAPGFMGMLNGSLSSHVKDMISDSIEKDYTKTTERDLAEHLENCIYL